MRKCMTIAAVAAVVLACGSGVQADVVMDWVTVGDPGNEADTRYATPGYGSVADTYNIGRYEVTNSQYTEFLVAVAASDPYTLYNTGMGSGYFPTQSDIYPTPEAPPGTDMIKGSANYNLAVGDLTNVGAYTAKPSDSAYGTFDQGGNLREWNEAWYGSYRVVRGGAFNTYTSDLLHAANRNIYYPTTEYSIFGFRVAQVP